MTDFKPYRRKGFVLARPYKINDGSLSDLRLRGISVSQADERNGSPKDGDMIACNTDNHKDQWLIAGDFFRKNYEITDDSITTD